MLQTLLTAVALLTTAEVTETSQVIQARHGQINATTVSCNGVNVYKVYGIPYAAPPVGNLRLSPPADPSNWSGVRDGTVPRPQCIQDSTQHYYDMWGVDPVRSEDCLFLNVYTTQLNGTRPVMVFIHGGSYEAGTADTYDGTQLATKGVVVVAVAYRLEALGFMRTPNGLASGNYGLLDLIKALEYVRDNIGSYGGDKNNVVLVGHSSGASLVGLLSATHKDLFHKAIYLSGSALSPWALRHANSNITHRPEDMTELLCKKGLKCADTTTDAAIVNCVRSAPADDFANLTWRGSALMYAGPFRPVVTGNAAGLLKKTPKGYFTSSDYSPKPSLRIFASHETASLFGGDLTRWVIEGNQLAQPAYCNDYQTVADRLVSTYGPYSNSVTGKILAAKMVQDVNIVAPMMEETVLVSKHPTKQPQYFGKFSYKMTNSKRACWVPGASHMDTVAYIMGYPFLYQNKVSMEKAFPGNWSTTDRAVTTSFQDMVINFVKEGDPTPPGSNGQRWTAYSVDTPKVFIIDNFSYMLPLHPRPAVSYPGALHNC